MNDKEKDQEHKKLAKTILNTLFKNNGEGEKNNKA